MDVRIKATDYEMNDGVAEYIEERMIMVRKHLGAANGTVRCEVEVGRLAGHSKHGETNWFAEVQLMRPGEGMVRATAQARTVQAAVDAVKDDILGLLRKEKTKTSSRLRRLGAKVKELLWSGRE